MANKILMKKIEKLENEIKKDDEKIAVIENSKKTKTQNLKSLYALKEREDKLIKEMEQIEKEVSER